MFRCNSRSHATNEADCGQDHGHYGKTKELWYEVILYDDRFYLQRVPELNAQVTKSFRFMPDVGLVLWLHAS